MRMFLLFVYIGSIRECSSKILMCYVTSWSVYRTGEGKFDMQYIDPHLCSHLIYAYTKLNSTSWRIESSDTWADYGVGNLKKLVSLKEENPDLKILTSIGGWNEGSEKYSQMVESEEHRHTFIESVLQYLVNNELDGLDIDWQYPTKRRGKQEDKENFVTLLKELRKEFDKNKFTLTVRLMGSMYASEGYDLPSISEAVDFINLKSYSYHGTWESETGSYSPLQSNDNGNVKFSVNYFLDEGVPNDKLLLGLTTEGNAFIMEKEVTDGIYTGKKAKGEFKGPWLAEDGIMAFNEVCSVLTRSDEWTEYWDNMTSTPYIIKENRFCSYDNEKSFENKLALLKEKDLAGASLYSLDSDDFSGLCYDMKFFLANTVKKAIRKSVFESVILNQEYIRKK